SVVARTHAGEIADELRVKEIAFGDVEASELRVKPNLPVLGPKLGPALPEVRTALAEGRFEELGDGRFQVDGHVLEPEEVLVERIGKEGWAVATDGAVTVALDIRLDDALRRDVGDAVGAEPFADALHELLRRRRAGRDADDRDAVEPRLVDLGLVVDQVRRDAGGVRDLDEPVRVGRVP